MKILPSTIYWNALQRFGILNFHGDPDFIAALDPKRMNVEAGLSEQTERFGGIWQPSLPSASKGFPDVEELTFEMRGDEADWLSERIQQSTEGTPLAWLVSRNRELRSISAGPWDEPLLASAPTKHRSLVFHAEMFSLVMNGAALLYNLLLARLCHERGFERLASLAENYEELVRQWATQVLERRVVIRSWDRENFWDLVLSKNERISPSARRFIDGWCEFAIAGDPLTAADNEGIVRLITDREMHQKRGQSRLVNERLLSQWGGSSGSGRLVYRWDRVSVMLSDIARGRQNAVA